MKELEPDSVVLPKIDFMGTIAQGTQTDIHNFENLLENYIQQYPAAEPTPLATEILTLIQDSTLADYQKLVDMGYINEEIQNEEVLMEDRMEDDEFGGKFSYEEDLLHYFVIAYPRSADIDMNRLRFDIANYNIDHYTRKDFDIETENLNEELSLVVVRALENKENGVIYHRAIIRNAPVFQTLSDVDYVNFVISSTNYRQILSEQSIVDYLKFFVKNYSRYIGSDFSDEEPELSPEEMMAKAREEEEMLRERGEFVVVETGAGQEGLFTTDIDTTQLFVLAVKDLNLSMRQTLRGFAEFNRNEYRNWNLGQQMQTSGDYQLLIVQGIPSLNESMSYFRSVVLNRDLFEPLGRTTYRNFLITEENLETLMEEENVDDYIGFFRNNYVNRDQSQRGSTETRATETAEATGTTETEQVVPEEYSGPYNLEIEKPHLFVFVIPVEGVQKTEFISGIEQFNSLGNDSLNLVIEEQPLDEFRENIVVSGFPDKETATRYFRTIVQNRDLYAPLGQGSYRNFLITEENFGIFMEEKNITDYMDFYKQIYLGE
jgi:hypothetical protein